MTYKLLLTEEALHDVEEAYNYYEDIRHGLGEDFLNILTQHYNTLIQNPFLYSFTDKKKLLRDVSILRFPFIIIYEIKDNCVIVYAVHNTRKKPIV